MAHHTTPEELTKAFSGLEKLLKELPASLGRRALYSPKHELAPKISEVRSAVDCLRLAAGEQRARNYVSSLTDHPLVDEIFSRSPLDNIQKASTTASWVGSLWRQFKTNGNDNFAPGGSWGMKAIRSSGIIVGVSMLSSGASNLYSELTANTEEIRKSDTTRGKRLFSAVSKIGLGVIIGAASIGLGNDRQIAR